jgi:hypothetical protein
VPSVSWLFPRPWYQDELDWMAAARQGLEASPSRGAMTTRGTFMNAERQRVGVGRRRDAGPVRRRHGVGVAVDE